MQQFRVKYWISLTLMVVLFSSCLKKIDSPLPGQLMVIHAVPGKGPLDLLLDGVAFNTSPIFYGQHTAYKQINGGSAYLAITDADQSALLLGGNLNTISESRQSIFIYYKPDTLRAFAVLDDTIPLPAAKAAIRFFDLCTGGPVFQAGTVTGGNYTKLFDQRELETPTSALGHAVFTVLDAGEVNFELRDATSNEVYSTINNLQLEAGKRYTIYARGLYNDPIAGLGLNYLVHQY